MRSRPDRMNEPPAGGRARLSVLLITKNEEDRIRTCLESVRWSDEIIVVDDASEDQTCEIAARFGAKVIHRPFSGSFASQRNAGLEAATGDWILQMDADERVTDELREAIRGVLSGSGVSYSAYQAWRKNWFLGRWMRHGGWYHRHLCLFRRDGARYDGLVHERVSPQAAVGQLDADVEHRPFTSLTQFIDRQNRYTSLQAEELLRQRGVLPERTIRHGLTWRPLKLFWKLYVKKRGFLDGMHGLVFCGLDAWVRVVIWAKYWELTRARVEHGDRAGA